MRKFRRVIRHGAYDPIRRGLPHRIEEATENVQQHPADIARVVEVVLDITFCLGLFAGVLSVRPSAN